MDDASVNLLRRNALHDSVSSRLQPAATRSTLLAYDSVTTLSDRYSAAMEGNERTGISSTLGREILESKDLRFQQVAQVHAGDIISPSDADITNVRSLDSAITPPVDIRHGEPNEAYHADEAYRSCSRVKTLLDSPLLYHQRYVAKTLPPFSSSALELGTLVHSWMELGDGFLDTLVAPPDSMLTDTGLVGKKAREWAQDNLPDGATLVSPKVRGQVLATVRGIKANPAAVEELEQIEHHEVSVRWVSADGHWLKCRADATTPDHWIDLKTTSEEDIVASFWNSVLKFKYHLQDAWYRRGMEACGMEAAPLRFIVVSTSATHDCQVVTLPDVVVAEGQRLMDAALAELRVREDLDWWLRERHGEVIELPFPPHVLGRMQ